MLLPAGLKLAFALGLTGVAFSVPARVPAQTVTPAKAVQRVDLIGAWRGRVEYTPKPVDPNQTGMSWLWLWPDGTWWIDVYSHWTTGPNRGGGRWRLVGDTLWLDFDAKYWLALQARLRTARHDSTQGYTDTTALQQLRAPSDSLFWSTTFTSTYLHHRTAYTIALTGQRLSWVRLDARSDTTHTLTAVHAVYERASSP